MSMLPDSCYVPRLVVKGLLELAKRHQTALLSLLLMLFTLSVGTAQAQTVISGNLTNNQTWTAAQSPYLLQGDVVLDNNALLSIQSGVTVRMAEGASFTLKQGALQALGTAAAPILITSNATTPAPGDWLQWRFGPGTDDTRTLLEHVIIEYGAGVAIESASPVLRHTELRHHSGPAVQMDLASSPIGSGNSAHGNALNAIAVPAGTIRGQVIWGLVGIPYLVQDGLVQVGQAPVSLEPTRLRLSPGVVALLRANLAQPAGAAGVVLDVASSVPSVASTVSRITIGAGQSGGDIELHASALGSTLITLSHAQLGMAETQVEVVQLPPLVLAPSKPTLGVGRPYPMTLTLPEPAPAGGSTVQLFNTDVSVLAAPISVVVPAGQRSVHFEVTGLSDGHSRLSARAHGFADAMVTLTVREKALVLPASVVVAPGGSSQVTLQTTEPAPASGLQVGLTSSNTTVVQAPASISIPAGQSSGQFTLHGAALGTAQLTASAVGYQSADSTVLVDAIALQTEPSGDISLNEGMERTLRVLLSKAAPPGGVAIAATSSMPSVAEVMPTELLVTEGQVYASQHITIKALSAGQTEIALTAPGLVGKTIQVTVREGAAALQLKPHRGSKVVVGKGMRSYLGGGENELNVQRIVNGSVSTGADAVTVRLRCVDTQVCTVPETVTIPAGQSQVAVSVTGVDVGSTQIEATADGYTAAVLEAQTVLPEVGFLGLDGNRTTSSVRDDFSVRLRVPGAAWPDGATLVEPVNVQLTLTEQTPAGVVDGFYSAATGGNPVTQLTISAGRNSSASTYIAQPAQAGTYRVQADVSGITSGQSAVQTVSAADQALRLSPHRGNEIVVGKGMRSADGELRVQRIVNGSASTGADAVTVRLRCVDTQVCTTPDTVTIPAGQSQVAVPVTGVDVGSTQTTIADHYDIVLEATYQTQVPAPVVLLEPMAINLPELQVGEEHSGELTLTNYGLIAARNLRLALPQSDQYYRYEFMADIPDSLPAKSRFVIPYRVTAIRLHPKSLGFSKTLDQGWASELQKSIASFFSAKASSCSHYVTHLVATYDWECANGEIEGGSCGTTFSRLVGKSCTSVGGGGGGGWGGGGGGGWGGGGWGGSSPIPLAPGCTPHCPACSCGGPGGGGGGGGGGGPGGGGGGNGPPPIAYY